MGPGNEQEALLSQKGRAVLRACQKLNSTLRQAHLLFLVNSRVRFTAV